MLHLFQLPAQRLAQTDRALRTLAHLLGFFVLGGLLYAALIPIWAGVGERFSKALVIGATFAVLDEIKKIAIAGRHLSWLEAGLNVLGAVCGTLVALWLHGRWMRRKTRRAKP